MAAGITGRQDRVIIGVEKNVVPGSQRYADARVQHVARRLHAARQELCPIDCRERDYPTVAQHLPAVAEADLRGDLVCRLLLEKKKKKKTNCKKRLKN